MTFKFYAQKYTGTKYNPQASNEPATIVQVFEEKQRTMTDSPSPIGGNSPEEGHYPTDPDLDVLVGSHRVRPIINTGSDLSGEKNPDGRCIEFT